MTALRHLAATSRAALLVSFVVFAASATACSQGASVDSSAPLSIGQRRQRLGPCSVSVSRVNVDQVGVDDGTREFIELFAPDGVGQPLSACGVLRIGSFEGSGTAPVCAREPASRFAEVGEVVVPADGFVLITRGGDTSLGVPPDATTAQSKGTWLENGPDYLVIEGEQGVSLALQVGSSPSCALPSSAAVEPPPGGGGAAGGSLSTDVEVLPKEGDTTSEERILVRCATGWRSVPLADSPPHTDRTAACAAPPPAATGTATSAPPTPTMPAPPTTGTATVPTPSPSVPPTTTPAPAPTPTPAPSEPPASELPCRVRFSKVDVAQPATVSTPIRDTREAVELFVEGEIPADATLATCGVVSFAPYRAGSKSEVSLCGSTAGTYGEVAIGHLVVPFPPYLLLAQRPDADSPLSVSKTSAILSNGPDYLTLRDASGAIVDAVMYPAPAAPTFYPDCPGFASAAPLPACEDPSKKGTTNAIALRCEDGSWQALPDTEVAYRAPAPPPCGPQPAPVEAEPGDGETTPDGSAPVDNESAGAAGNAGAGTDPDEGSAPQEGDAGAAGRTARPPLPASEGAPSGGASSAAANGRLPLREHACAFVMPSGEPAPSHLAQQLGLLSGAVWLLARALRRPKRALIERDEQLCERRGGIERRRQSKLT